MGDLSIDRQVRGLGRVIAVGTLAVSVAVAGCAWTEQTEYAYDVWNYSSNQYVVRMTYQNGFSHDLGVVPRAIVGEQQNEAPPKHAIVYDATCSKQLAVLEFSRPVEHILIDVTGAISIPSAPLGNNGTPTQADPSDSHPGPVPASCPQTDWPSPS